MSIIRWTNGNQPGKENDGEYSWQSRNQGNPHRGESTWCVCRSLKHRRSLPVPGVHSVRGEQVGEAPKNQTVKGLLPG